MIIRPYLGLILSFALFFCAASVRADVPPKNSGNSPPSLVNRVEQAADRDLKAGMRSVDRGVHAAAGGIERGAEATAHAVDTLAKKMGATPASTPPKDTP
jgi:hypothetical protein